MAPRHSTSPFRHSRGTSLIEALIALLMLTLGLLALAKVQVQARQYADLTRHQAAAMQLAQSELEGLRVTSDFQPATRDLQAIDTDGTPYHLDRRVAHHVVPGAHGVTVEIAWTERDGTLHTTVLHTILANVDSAHSGALVLARAADP